MTVRRDEVRARLLFTDELPIPPILRPAGTLRVEMRAADVHIHSALPPTTAWTYAGILPGPTIEVRRGQELEIKWVNRITTAFPVTVVRAGGTPSLAGQREGVVHPQNEPGSGCGDPGDFIDHRAEQLPAWTVVHLHGGHTASDSDGWTENAFLNDDTGESSQRTVYANDQRATMLWYHDHAMGITRLNVFAGLAGAYLIRDEEEDALSLPAGPYEMPLVIQDRNLELDGDELTGRLVHKVEVDARAIPNPEDRTMEFFGPFTLVNGRIWPRCPVEPRAYRFRVLNGSNARTYQLILLDETGGVRNDVIRQIGSDGGLLPVGVRLSELAPMADGRPRGLILAPAERADLIIDFGSVPGRRLTWVNVAGAPYAGTYAHSDADPSVTIEPGQRALRDRLVHAEVMRFDVGSGPAVAPLALPPILSTVARPTPAGAVRYLGLNEDAGSGMLLFNELVVVDSSDPTPADFALEWPEGTVRLRNRPVRFSDAINWFATEGEPEMWRIINFTSDMHPVHVHLTQFQALARDRYQIPPKDEKGLVRGAHGQPPPVVRYIGAGALDANELGWKDTIRVDPGEMVTIAIRFHGYTGRYMYHCHVLEHEDMDMMRPLVVLPASILAFMRM
jgi:FtsP/CotA-like multicopper oxidase with cupredoxin domain